MKSLDKKKTKKLDNPIQVYKTDWRKMTPKRINGLVEKLNTPKLKELDKTIMEKLLEQFHCKGGKTLNGEDVYLMTKSDIDNLLTQQRTELLEEIKKIINEELLVCPYCFNRIKDYECTACDHYDGYSVEKRIEQINENINLFNKKDE